MRRTLCFLASLAVFGCGGGRPANFPALLAADSVRARATAAQPGAPDAIRRGDQERVEAIKAQHAGDSVLADLYAERATAEYARAEAVSRLARAEAAAMQHQSALEASDAARRAFRSDRILAEARSGELDRELFLLREASAPESSGKADPKREAARLVAANSLALDARLLCGAAKLVGAPSDALSAIEAELGPLERSLETKKISGGPAIDLASRLRAKCLATLTTTRRASATSSTTSAADALFAEIGASNLGRLLPSRDERGIVLKLETPLPSDASRTFAEIARVSQAHPEFALEVVLHDAVRTAAEDKRLLSIVDSLVSAGADRAKILAVAAGTRAPLADPSDAAKRARNARVEIVLIER